MWQWQVWETRYLKTQVILILYLRHCCRWFILLKFPRNLLRKLSLIVNLELYSRGFHLSWEEKPSICFWFWQKIFDIRRTGLLEVYLVIAVASYSWLDVKFSMNIKYFSEFRPPSLICKVCPDSNECHQLLWCSYLVLRSQVRLNYNYKLARSPQHQSTLTDWQDYVWCRM